MAEINYIRHEAERKDCSYSEIAKRTGKDRRTVKKYVEMDDFSPTEEVKHEEVLGICSEMLFKR